jgi:type II secretory pathway pseudopilin PulG
MGLIEVLIALVVLGVGLAGLARLQLWLWTGADAARQQGEATRLAQQDVEALRAWVSPVAAPGQPSWADITGHAATPVSGLLANTNYTIERSVGTPSADPGAPRYKMLGTWARWVDREGVEHELAVASLIGAFDPYWSGAVMLAPGADTGGLADPGAIWTRHPGLPPDASLLADGRLVWKVAAAADVAWVFDRRTGQASQKCSGNAGLPSAELNAASLGSCVAVSGLVVWGTVRFSTASLAPGSTEAADPPSAALDLDLRVTLTSTGHPSPGWQCDDNSVAAVAAALQPGAVRYLCVVQPAGVPPRWSGRLDIVPVGWPLGTAAPEALRVCRYSTDQNGNGRIDNAEHPASYVDVDAPLGNQNFLVVPMLASCPGDTGVDLGATLHLVNATTVAHQP